MKLQLPCPNQTKLLEERLQKGKEAAARLQTLLLLELDNNNNNIGESSAAAAQLALQILTSFTDSLSVLEPINEFCRHDITAADAPPTSTRGGCSSTYNRNNPKSTAAVGQRKKNPTGPKDRRGSYKRRNVSDSWVNLSSNMEDEYAWRKYGQKDILNSKFPRCYFRCTHKHDKGCKATKQVQRIIDQKDPLLLMYQTTYFGFHTCKTNMMMSTGNLPPPPAMPEYSSSSCLFSFQDESKDVIPINPGSCAQKNSSSSSSASTGETTNWLEELIITTTSSQEKVVVLDDVVVNDDHHHHRFENLDNNLNYDDFENGDDDDDQYFFGDC